jgi:hypothetical protein
VPFTAAAGTDTILFTLYAGAGGSGAVLGTGTAVAPVVGGQSFTVDVSVGGVVAKIVVAEATPLAQGAASTVPVTVSAQDSGGNTIIGSAAYANPITLTDSDASGATTLSPTLVTSPSTAVTLAYTGGVISGGTVTISGTASNVATSAVTPATIAVAPGGSANACALPTIASPHLYIANDGGGDTLSFAQPFNAGSAGTDLNAIGNPVAIKAGANGTLFVAAFGSDSGTSTAGDVVEYRPPYATATATIGAGQFAGPRGIAIDGNLDLFVTDSGHNRVLEFVPPYAAAPAVLASGVSSPYAIALSPNCNLFVTTNATVVEYAPPYTGTPIATISTDLMNPQGLAFDQAGDLFVADPSANKVFEYAAPYTGTPVAQITLPTSAVGLGIALDSQNDLYVADYDINAVSEYAAPYTGGPLVTISGPYSNLFLPADLVGP